MHNDDAKFDNITWMNFFVYCSILLADYGRVLKICDFGTASYLRPEMSHSKGSIKWMAPEVSKGKLIVLENELLDFCNVSLIKI